MITQELLDAFAAAIVADFNSNFPATPNRFSISFEPGKKYIRVVKTHWNHRSVHSFLEVENGNIWKAASWKAPAKNTPRGNISTLTPRITCWTSAT